MSIQPGDHITDFRDHVWTFVRISRMPGSVNGIDYSSGKIIVKDELDRTRELYPSVFDLIITKEGNLVPKEVT